MRSQLRTWNVAEAKDKLDELLDDARSGRIQRIAADDGLFEVKFVASRKRERAGALLAKGGPLDQGD